MRRRGVIQCSSQRVALPDYTRSEQPSGYQKQHDGFHICTTVLMSNCVFDRIKHTEIYAGANASRKDGLRPLAFHGKANSLSLPPCQEKMMCDNTIRGYQRSSGLGAPTPGFYHAQVNHGCFDGRVPHEILNGSNVGSALKELGGEGMSEGMAGELGCEILGSLQYPTANTQQPISK